MTYLKDHHVEHLKRAFPDHQFITDPKKRRSASIALLMPGFANALFLDMMTHLEFVQLLTAGYDTVDLAYFKNRKIRIAYAKDVFSIQIAEDVFAKILYLNRHLASYTEQQKNGIWKVNAVKHDIHGSTVGFIGAGSIAKEIAIRMKSFGAQTIGYRRSKHHDPAFDEMVYDEGGFDHLLKRSDIIIISIPLSHKTYHLIGDEQFKKMKKNALIINVARGDIIDQNALMRALDQGLIRGAGLDVTSPEPLPEDHPLWKTPHLFITPHQASSSPYLHDRLLMRVIETLDLVFRKHHIPNLIE
jgi:phosphoglycerate dehydrogenase-like enzyme